MKVNELPLESFAWTACGEWLAQMKTLISICSVKYIIFVHVPVEKHDILNLSLPLEWRPTDIVTASFEMICIIRFGTT